MSVAVGSLTVPNRVGYPEVFGNFMIFPLWPKPTPAPVASGVAWVRVAWGGTYDGGRT
jgi:hypothetical protein